MKVPGFIKAKLITSTFKILFGLLCLIASAKVSIDFSEIELLSISLQTLILLVLARILGFQYIFYITLFYILLGLLGFKVFSSSPSGIELLFSSGIGYLLGFLVCLPLACLSNTKFLQLFLQFLMAHFVILLCGSVALALNLGLEWKLALLKGFFQFIPAALIKSMLAALIVRFLLHYKILK